MSPTKELAIEKVLKRLDEAAYSLTMFVLYGDDTTGHRHKENLVTALDWLRAEIDDALDALSQPDVVAVDVDF